MSGDTDSPGLSWWERLIARVFGAAGAGVGGAGVFLSDNQAGTTAILLLGAVFLLMGVQGTRIIRAGTDSVELERKKQGRKLTERAVEAIEQRKDPERAAELVSAARTIDPSLALEPSFNYLNHQIYELKAYEAVRAAYSELLTRSVIKPVPGSTFTFNPDRDPETGRRYDAILTMPERGRLVIEIKQYRSGRVIHNLIVEQMAQMVDEADAMGLLISNLEISARTRALLKERYPGIRLEVVRWSSEEDSEELVAALERLLS